VCGGETHPDSQGEEVRSEVHSHVQAIRRAVETLLYPDELYERFLDHLIKALDAHGAAVWRLDGGPDAELAAAVGAIDGQGRGWQESRALLSATIAASSQQQEAIPPDDSRNPTRSLLLIQQVHPRCPLVIVVAQRGDARSVSVRGYSAFLKRMADLLANAKCLPWI
jgi:hypothetical protein